MSGFWSATRLVAQREINAQVRGKGFWISFAVFVAGLFAAAILPGLFDDGDRTTVAVVGPDAERLVATTDLEPRPAATVDEARTLVRDGEVRAAVAMPVRMFAGDPAPWEPFASMALLAVTVTVFVLVASRLYTGSLLQTGARVRLRRAWSEVEHRAGR